MLEEFVADCFKMVDIKVEKNGDLSYEGNKDVKFTEDEQIELYKLIYKYDDDSAIKYMVKFFIDKKLREMNKK